MQKFYGNEAQHQRHPGKATKDLNGILKSSEVLERQRRWTSIPSLRNTLETKMTGDGRVQRGRRVAQKR